MPNRIIKETITTSETINELSDAVEAFFYRLLVKCDDYGLYDGRVAIVRAGCYPLRLSSITEAEVGKRIALLEKAGLIQRYSVDGKPYIKIVKWNNHQQIRAAKSKFPPPETSDINGNHLISDDITCTRNPIQSNPIQSNTSDSAEPHSIVFEDTPPEQDDHVLTLALPDDAPIPADKYPEDEFKTLWKSYPNKTGKEAAYKTWKKLRRSKLRLTDEQISEKVALYVCWCEKIQRTLQDLSTFLNPDGVKGITDWMDDNDVTARLAAAGIRRSGVAAQYAPTPSPSYHCSSPEMAAAMAENDRMKREASAHGHA